MKKIVLFEEFINEDKMQKFLNHTVKNPVTGKEVKISSIIDDIKNPLYKKLQAKKAEIQKAAGGGMSAEMKEAMEYLKELQEEIAEHKKERTSVFNELQDLKDDLKNMDDEGMIDMTKEQIEEKEDELDQVNDEISRVKHEIDEVTAEIKDMKKG